MAANSSLEFLSAAITLIVLFQRRKYVLNFVDFSITIYLENNEAIISFPLLAASKLSIFLEINKETSNIKLQNRGIKLFHKIRILSENFYINEE